MTAVHSPPPGPIRNLHDLVDFLQRTGSRLPVNMFQATGHVIAETENFLRMRHLGEIRQDCPYLLILPQTGFARAIGRLYASHFTNVVVSDQWHAMAREVALYHPELTVDVGVSHLKTWVPPGQKTRIFALGSQLWHMLPRGPAIDLTVRLYRRRALSRGYMPLWHDVPLPGALAERIGRVQKYALIHLKVDPINATARPTDPATYLDAMAYLHDNGYRLVMAGREPMPDAFRRFDIYNYAGDPLASFENDLILFRHARFALLAGSGISYLAESFDIPFVYANYWHLCFPPFARRAVALPSVLTERQSGRMLPFSEHYGLLSKFPEFSFWNFPDAALTARPAAADEILAATQEALGLSHADIPPMTPQQQHLNGMDPVGCARISDSRVSQHFLERFAPLMGRAAAPPASRIN
ncbi:putative glycosyltransferase (TIGR04372 family) [Azospirillum fermentarium]|uniref:TIGR04372 family glycosyltransferase n=1 Tax=Azospirillum fermentarium TaxID=1233114 RepID=UPI00222628B9|nr:TIGR04372 family glycosyltransferase [Azospirillum fermentarium]MCW2249539.1 putative glycosyltransferase (TIGR04372 family) [Azospirillum fermentarium]